MKKIGSKKIVSLILFLGLIGFILTAGSSISYSEEPVKLVFSQFEMKGSHWDLQVCQPWFAELKKRTNGRIEIEQHWNSELVGLFEIYDSIMKGVVDFGMILPSMFPDKFPMDSILIYTTVNIDCHRPGKVWYELYKKFPEFQDQYKNTPLLALTPTPCNVIGTRKGVQIKKVEDCKGLKMPGAGPAPESRQKVVGIVPVSLPPPEVYMALKTGTLDGLALMIYSLVDFKWTDVIANLTIVGTNGAPWSYVMSQKAWNRLPADIQTVFKDMIPWVVELSDKAYNLRTKWALETYPKEYGTNIFKLSQEELDKWAELDNPNLDNYIAQLNKMGLPGDAVKAEYIKLQKKYAAPEYAY